MDAERDVVSENAKLGDLHKDVETMTNEVELADLRTIAAIAVTQLIDDIVEDDEEIRIIAADIADCWQSLTPSVRKEYDRLAGSSGLASFAGDYSVLVDCAWRSSYGAVGVVAEWTATKMCQLSWQIRVAQILQRKTVNEPPNADWLGQFPLTTDPDWPAVPADPSSTSCAQIQDPTDPPHIDEHQAHDLSVDQPVVLRPVLGELLS